MDLLKQLISIPSLSGQESALQDYIKGYCPKAATYTVGTNTLYYIPGKDSGKALLFNAHTDTVKPGNQALWRRNPYKAWRQGSRLYGLGASDEKAGVAMCLLLCANYIDTQPDCDLWFMFVNEEETTGQGSADCLHWFAQNHQHKYQQIAGILPEPTGLTHIEIGHRGNVFIKLTVTGDSGHGSRPHQVKINATLTMASILLELGKLEKKWAKYQDKVLGSPSIAAGTSIMSGSIDTPNKIADTCTATLDIRTTPKLHEKVMPELKHFLNKYPITIAYQYPPIPHGLTAPDSHIVRACKHLLPHIPTTVTLGSTDLCFFSRHDIPAIIFGPGEKECIHAPNEYCYPKKINQAVDIIKQLIPIWVKTQ